MERVVSEIPKGNSNEKDIEWVRGKDSVYGRSLNPRHLADESSDVSLNVKVSVKNRRCIYLYKRKSIISWKNKLNGKGRGGLNMYERKRIININKNEKGKGIVNRKSHRWQTMPISHRQQGRFVVGSCTGVHT